MRLILSVKSAADEPNLSKQAGDYGPVSPPAVIVRLRVQSALAGALEKSVQPAERPTRYRMDASYCAPQQSQVNAAHSATSRGASARTSSTIQRSGKTEEHKSKVQSLMHNYDAN